MDLREFNNFCGSFVATSHVVQWNNAEVWKVGSKVFAIGFTNKTGQPAYTFKVSHLNYDFLSDYEGYQPAPYFASRGMKWIQQIETSGSLDDDLKYYLAESYRIVAGGLSKRKRAKLGIDI